MVALLDKSKGKVAVLGGINIKIEDSTDLFMPLMFQVNTVDRLEVFGDSSLCKGCINFSYFKDLIGDKREIAKESRFKEAKLSLDAILAIKRVNFH